MYLFPGRHGLGHIHPDSSDKILRAAFIELGIEGASTHSFRLTSLTQMHRSGVPLKVIQKISGHKTLSALQKYLEVLDEDLESAIRVTQILKTTQRHHNGTTHMNRLGAGIALIAIAAFLFGIDYLSGSI